MTSPASPWARSADGQAVGVATGGGRARAVQVIQNDFAITCVRPDSHQLFFLFAGTGLRPLGLHTFDVIARTPLASRNIVLLRDQDNSGYESGFGGEYSSPEGMVRWQQAHIATHFPHVREVFCVGVSIGGFTAVQTACRLRARAAWSLSGRVIRPGVVQERLRVSTEIYMSTIGRTRLAQMTAEEQRKLVERFDTPAMRELRYRLADDPALLARERLHGIAADVRANGTATDCHIYCVETNVLDCECAEAFRGCPNATLHYIAPEPGQLEKPIGFTEPDHSIVSILHRRGQWATLFSEYLS